jgi:LysM repeat protein
VVAKSGDSYESLAKLFAVSARSLRKFNDVAKDDTLAEGDIVYIEQKVEGWRGEGLLHEVQEGETLHMVSQLYGIRLKSLTKQNSMRSNVTLAEGRTIRIQKW